LNLVQQGLLERAFHDGLYPALLYRAEAQYEEWAANTGTEIFMTRPGLLPAITKPLAAGTDPTPQAVAYEQWGARLERFAGTIDTHTPTSAVSNADQFLRNIQQLGLQAGMSLNRIPRNAMFQAYLSGQTVLITAASSGQNALRVASLNGFTDVVTKGTNVRPATVSNSSPLTITIDPETLNITAQVVGFDPDDPEDLLGPGTLFLSANLASNVAVRKSVVSSAAPKVIRAGGGSSVDFIATSDTFVIQNVVDAVNYLRKNNVQPHEDGWYHAHINADGNSQVFLDTAFRQLNQTQIDLPYYQEAFIGTGGGAAFFLNNESPEDSNAGALTSTGTNAKYASDIGAEVVNETNVRIGRILITGRGAMYEKGLDETSYITEAGVTGKIGEFQVVNAGIEVATERVRLILRAPINRLMDQVAATWSITTSFPIPSDVTSGGPQRYKRAVIIEHALN
jgi:hypothetical protein